MNRISAGELLLGEGGRKLRYTTSGPNSTSPLMLLRNPNKAHQSNPFGRPISRALCETWGFLATRSLFPVRLRARELPGWLPQGLKPAIVGNLARPSRAALPRSRRRMGRDYRGPEYTVAPAAWDVTTERRRNHAITADHRLVHHGGRAALQRPALSEVEWAAISPLFDEGFSPEVPTHQSSSGRADPPSNELFILKML